MPRICIRQGPGCQQVAIQGRSRCGVCGPTSPRGPSPYDHAHQELRKEATNILPLICGICGRAILPGQARHLDHIKPLSQGGTATLDNVQWAHARCNIAKGGRNRQR